VTFRGINTEQGTPNYPKQALGT